MPDAASAIPGYTLRALLGAIAVAAAVFFAAGLGVGHEAAGPGDGIPTLGFQEQLRELERERDEARRERDEARRERDEDRARIKELERQLEEARKE